MTTTAATGGTAPGTGSASGTGTTPAVPRPTFDDVMALVPGPGGVAAADLHPGWTIGGRPKGGYLLAILGRAAAAATSHPHVLAASAHYLRAPEPAPAEVSVTVLRTGRSAGQIHARLTQDGTTCVEALLTLGTLVPSTPRWDGGLPAPGTTPRSQGVRLPGTTPSGVQVALLDEVDLRLDPECLAFADGHPRGMGELRGWLALPGEAPFDPTSLLFAVDALPPATFDIAPSGWVPTFELTAYVRALPAPGPVRILQRAGLVDGDRVDEACFVWDTRGRLVAQATQLAGIRLG